MTRCWHIVGRHFADPTSANWREQLAKRLGKRPRRIGTWAELALYGALQCMDDAGETFLPAGAMLSVSSTRGPDQALRAALQTTQEDGLPMPLGFLQSQPNQMLGTLAQHLDWSGDARMLTSRDPLAALRLACLEAPLDGLLAGWVDETEDGHSLWLRLQPATQEFIENAVLPATLCQLVDPAIKHIRLHDQSGFTSSPAGLSNGITSPLASMPTNTSLLTGGQK